MKPSLSAHLRPFILFGFALLATGRLPAQEKSTSVTVPAGGELSRTYEAAAQISVHLLSRPFFGAAPAGWPALEVGPASLAFVRDTKGGGLVLLGDQPLSLPLDLALGEDGRSLLPLDFTFSYSQPKATATLMLEGQDFVLAATAPAGPLRVVVAAGQAKAWTLDSFDVITSAAPSTGTDGKSSGASQDPSPAAPATTDAQAFAEAAQRRARLADAVTCRTLTPAQAVDELKHDAPRPWALDADIDFALAAISVGESLVGRGEFDAAEPFFRAAEPALAATGQRSAKTGEQVLCLKELAWIRSHYLNQEAQAKADIEAACRLSPQNQYLRLLRERLTGLKESR
jgi:hypothetical protein